MSLKREFKTLAAKLQEAALDLSHNDIAKGLQDCLNDEYPGEYCYIADVFGDAESGDVVYCHNGEYLKAPYEIGTLSGKRTHDIDTDSAIDVLPRTVYDEEADEMDDMAGVAETDRIERFPGTAELKLRPLGERFISKTTRDGMDSGDFAGSGKSFPIQKPGDIKAAVNSIGRGVAGGQSASSIKSKIIAIATRKGWTASLPKAWQDKSSSESNVSRETSWKPDGVLLVESAATFLEEPKLQEAATADYPIKLMSPGRGSSGYYPADVLKKAAESRVFKAGTQMFWNHDTDAEENARPEGDLNRLAAVTTSDAAWNESGMDGPGLYARAKVFSDYGDKIKEKGPHIGLSIRAGGERNESATAPDGKPRVITALKNALSVDFVTKAGRDGKIFTEAATVAESTNKGDDMELKEVQALIDAKLKEAVAPLEAKLNIAEAENKRLSQHLALTQAPAVIREALSDIRLPDAAKKRIVERLAPAAPLGADGQIDKAKLKELVESEAKIEAAFLKELGMGVDVASMGVRMTEAEAQTAETASEKQFKETIGSMADMMIGPELAEGSVTEVARLARSAARKAFTEGRAA
jgi:hypothetical protein